MNVSYFATKSISIYWHVNRKKFLPTRNSLSLSRFWVLSFMSYGLLVVRVFIQWISLSSLIVGAFGYKKSSLYLEMPENEWNEWKTRTNVSKMLYYIFSCSVFLRILIRLLKVLILLPTYWKWKYNKYRYNIW